MGRVVAVSWTQGTEDVQDAGHDAHDSNEARGEFERGARDSRDRVLRLDLSSATATPEVSRKDSS